MPKNKFLSKRMCDIKSTCKEIGNQYIFLVTIVAAITAQEIDDNDDLDNLAGFLIVLGEQLAFASSIRDTCEANAGEEPQNVINPELSIDKDLYKSKERLKKALADKLLELLFNIYDFLNLVGLQICVFYSLFLCCILIHLELPFLHLLLCY